MGKKKQTIKLGDYVDVGWPEAEIAKVISIDGDNVAVEFEQTGIQRIVPRYIAIPAPWYKIWRSDAQ